MSIFHPFLPAFPLSPSLCPSGGENYNSYVAQRVGTNAAATFAGKAEVAKEDIEAVRLI